MALGESDRGSAGGRARRMTGSALRRWTFLINVVSTQYGRRGSGWPSREGQGELGRVGEVGAGSEDDDNEHLYRLKSVEFSQVRLNLKRNVSKSLKESVKYYGLYSLHPSTI